VCDVGYNVVDGFALISIRRNQHADESPVAAFILCSFIWSSVAIAGDWPGEAGKSNSIKSWPGRDFEAAKSAGMPLCVYFFDPEIKSNPRAKLIEGKGALGNAELRAMLPKFICLKIKTDGTDYTGWPAPLRNAAKGVATLVLMSSDMRSVISYDRSFQNHQITPELVMAGMAKILDYEEKMKGKMPVAAKKPEAEDKKAAEAKNIANVKVPGLAATVEAAPAPKQQPKRKVASPADE
jgi:hypothetical protein